MAEIQKVTPTDILAQEGASKPVVPYTFLQLVGVQLAAGVGSVMAVVILVLMVYWMVTAPSLSVGGQLDAEKARSLLENQKQLRAAHLDEVMRIFDEIVLKCLFPLFTSILGYIFGSQSRATNRE